MTRHKTRMGLSFIRKRGRYLKQIRERLGLEQKEVASAIGLSAPYLSEMERDIRSTTDKMLVRIAPAFDMSPEALLEEILKLERADPETMPPSVALREDPPPYPITRIPDAPHRAIAPSAALCPDLEALAGHFVGELGREKAFSLLQEFTEAAKGGDETAFSKARALLQLLPKLQ